MDLQAHKRTLGIIHLIYGILTTVVFLFIGSIVAAVAPFISAEILENGDQNAEQVIALISSAVRGVFILIFIFSALPSIIAGIGLLSRKSWGLVISLIAGCIAIFSFPFGTALGVYSIYVFVQNNRAVRDESNQE